MTAAKMLAAARADLGLTGRPNWITRAYAKKHGNEYLNAPWCDQGITEWGHKSGNAAAVLPNGDRAFTVWHAQDAKDIGRWHSGTADNIKRYAKPAAVVFFDWDGSNSIGQIDHVGLIERVLPDGRIQTIEANTGGGTGAVLRRIRGPEVVAGFFNPDYEGDDMPSAKEIADAVYDRFTHTIPDDVWAAREGILDVGQKIDPRTAFRQIWAYTKDGYARNREILTVLHAQDAVIRELLTAVRSDTPIDVDALMGRIKAEIEGVTVRLAVDPGAES
ncbi:CHAP domain-containing protein [Microbispora rosea]|uniref:CHAP domain-containing protein n=1 Tax=Microbispora rosea TaxID=58117 RepID=UPI00068AEE53|nr:CHAP domain-containing protein [Microbispora rosea]